MVEVLKAKGFVVIEHRGVQLHKLVDWVADTKPELSDEQASELGAGLKADVVVVGVSSAGESTNIMGYETKSFKGNFSARVLRTETSEEMITISKEAVATNAVLFILKNGFLRNDRPSTGTGLQSAALHNGEIFFNGSIQTKAKSFSG